MLVITRKDQESILIDDDIVITVVGLSKSRVAIGIKGEGHRIRRAELPPLPSNAGTETTDAPPN